MPLYAQALFCIQSLRPSLENLARFASVLESGFIGRRDKPQLIKDQFESFWNATYQAWETPSEGWPESIQRCLDADIDETERVSSPLPPSSPTVSVCELRRTPETGGPADIVPETPLTPTTSLVSYNSSSTRRLEDVTDACFPNLLPSISPTSPLRFRTTLPDSIPVTLTTPECLGKRTFSAGFGCASMSTPKSKRRRVEERDKNKENASPRSAALTQIPSVTERIAMRSPLGAVDSSLNGKVSTVTKRQLETESEEEGDEKDDDVFVDRLSRLKEGKFNKTIFGRRRSESVGSDDDLQERSLPVTLLQSSCCSNDSDKRYVMDAVEIPPFEKILFDKRMRSASPQSSCEGAQTLSIGARIIHKMKPSSKRMKIEDNSFESSSSSIRAPRTGRGLTIVELSKTMSAPMHKSCSSDDDPRYGQVTPHHLISPGPKKVLDLLDPPSDDSLLSSSPTKSAVARRFRR